jgi:hypothetical protein
MPYEGGTASAGFFADSALQLVRRLEGETNPEARQLVEHVKELANLFEEWRHRRPADEERVKKIRELFDCNRRALDYFAARGIPTTTRPGPQQSGTNEVGPPSTRKK